MGCIGRNLLIAGALSGALAMSLLAVPAWGAKPPPKEEAPAAKPPEADALPSLAQILSGMEEFDANEQRMRSVLSDDGRLRELSAEIDQVEKALSTLRRNIGNVADDLLGFHELVDLGNAVRAADQRLSAAEDELISRAGTLDVQLDRLAEARARTTTWIEVAGKRDAPPALRERIESRLPRIDTLAREMRSRRDQALGVLAAASRVRSLVADLRSEVRDHRDKITAGLRGQSEVPIWRIEPERSEWERVARFFKVEVAKAFAHAVEHAGLLLTIAIVAFALTRWLIVSTRERLATMAEADSHARRVYNLFQLPKTAALVAALAAVIGLGPPGPINFYHLLWAFLALPAVFLTRAVLGTAVSLSLYTLAGVAISQDLLGTLLDPLPLAGRALLITQCSALAFALAVDLRSGGFEKVIHSIAARPLRWGVATLIALLVGSVLATLLGYLGVARIGRTVVLGVLGISLVLAVAAGLLYGLALALMQTRAGQSLRVVRMHERTLHRTLRRILGTAAFAAWVVGMVLMLGLGDEANKLADTLYRAEIPIGSTRIAMTGVWAGLAVVLGTFIVVRIVIPLLEFEILPRLTNKAGMPFAVATVTRYLLITTGLMLALAAMDIDLTKVTLLAGALGVGIGFGLQSVVNNFVSGLILLVERPVNVGDIVSVGTMRGTVQRIGVRSSSIRTPSGVEVIVPNADLIAKEVTNWTPSSRQRCLEIFVGAAYGTDLDRVVRLLEDAARDVSEVLVQPPPMAACIGFGDSSVDFRLEAWIDNFPRGMAVESELRMAISKAFAEANIEIPFPQRDVHLRSSVHQGAMSAAPGDL